MKGGVGAVFLLVCFAWQGRKTSAKYLCFSKGFGVRSSTKKGKVALTKVAKKLLKKHNNDVDSASNEHFQSLMEKMEGSANLHEARVAATWDTVALFLPQDYARTKNEVEPYVHRRLRHVVSACGTARSLLDVGCGDGALVPYLDDSCAYSGLDLSKEMVDLGKRRHPGKNFWMGGFPQDVPAGASYDAVLFNGSLQFFRDTRQAIEDAAGLLNPGGRIVLSHVNGGKFVQDECRQNPLVAVRGMPNNLNLATMAELAGLVILDKSSSLGTELDPKLDGNNDDFYLVVLEKPID